MSKRLGGIIGCKDKTPSWRLNGFPAGTNITLGQQYNVGEKPTVILYTYINRHAEPPNITEQKRHYTVDPMLLPSGNPFKCHEEVLYFQLLIPPKRFDIFSP